MAKNNRNVNIGIGADLSELNSSVQQLSAMMRKLGGDIKASFTEANDGAEKATTAFQGFDRTASIAGMNLMNLSNLVSDLPYGFRGIANNLSYAGQMFAMLIQQAGGLTAAFKSLWASLIGPAGILLAFNTLIAGLDYFIGNGKKAKEETDKLNTSLLEELIKLEALKNVITEQNTSRENQILAYKELQKLVPELSNMTYDEALDTDKLTSAVDRLIESKVKMALVDSKIKEIASKEEERIKLIKNRSKAIKEEVSFLEKIGNFFTSTEGGDILYHNVDAAAQRVSDRIGGLVYEINESKKELERLLSDESVYQQSGDKNDNKDKSKTEHIKSEALEDFKEISKIFDERNEKIKELTTEMSDIVEQGGNLMAFEGKLYGTKLGNGIRDGIEESMSEIPPTLEKSAKPIADEMKKLSEQMKAQLQQYLGNAIADLGEALGGLLVNMDGFKQSKEQFLMTFANFLGQFGRLLITFGVASLAFWDSLKLGPAGAIAAIAAGTAAVIAAGAIKGAMKKASDTKMNTSNYGSAGNVSSGGYGSGGEIQIYTRLDGRDLVLSGARTQYISRR